MPEPIVKILNTDIYAAGYVSKLMAVNEQKTYGRAKVIQNEYSFEVRNFDDFFSIGNARSGFNNAQWRFSPCQVWDDNGELIWDGEIYDIARDHETKRAIVYTRNALSKFWGQTIQYQSLTWETPADAALNLLATYGYTKIDTATFLQSAAVYTAAGVTISCNFNLSDNTTLQQALEKIAEAGCADCWSHNNNIYFRAWQKYTGNTNFKIGTVDILGSPKVQSGFDILRNDYNNSYNLCNKTPKTDAGSNNIGAISRGLYGTISLPDLSGEDISGQIRYQNAASAIWAGEQYIKRSHQSLSKSIARPLEQVSFTLPYNSATWIDLQSIFKLTFSEEGWTDRLFEVYEFTRDYTGQSVDLICYEVVTDD